MQEILADDRAQIIHNLFLNSYTERSSYYVLATVIDYIRTERDYLPWRVVYIHLNRMASILQYRKAFYELSVRKNTMPNFYDYFYYKLYINLLLNRLLWHYKYVVLSSPWIHGAQASSIQTSKFFFILCISFSQIYYYLINSIIFFNNRLLKETIIHIACSMQDPFCIANATALWPQAFDILASGNFENA